MDQAQLKKLNFEKQYFEKGIFIKIRIGKRTLKTIKTKIIRRTLRSKRIDK
jgi:hypothetical protein